jgi:tetratricopeptide (TPR) repeat protein
MAQAGGHSNHDPSGARSEDLDKLFAEGMAHHRAGLLAESEQLYHRVLQADPRHFDSLHLLGVIYYQRGDYAEAVRQIDLALQQNSNAADAYNNRGNALKKMGRFEEALASYSKAIALNPEYAPSFSNRGSVYRDLKRFDEAIADFDHAITLKPDFAEAFNNRGNVLIEQRRLDEALASYERAIALRPNNPDTHNSRGNALRDLGRLEEARASYEQAARLKPDYQQAVYNGGVALFNLTRFEAALAKLSEAVRLNANHAEAFYHRALTLKELGRIEEAIADLDRAISLKPDYVDAIWNRAVCRLRAGRYREAWLDYEWRWHTAQMAPQRPVFPVRQWTGKTDVVGKTLLLHDEQGFGDTIMAARYIPQVARAGARVILGVPAELAPLLATIEEVGEIYSTGQILPPFDLHCPMMSLPAVFETTLETIPREVPYLSVPKAYLEKWATRIPRSGVPRIGICWAGNRRFPYNAERSIGLQRMLPLLSRSDARYVSLQKERGEGDDDILRANPQIIALPDGIDDFADTAAIIAALDLVISSDTAIVHLAGALGKPVWILVQFVPDWRWLLDRDDSPWYPTARLFRQRERGNWDPVIADVSRALDLFLAR